MKMVKKTIIILVLFNISLVVSQEGKVTQANKDFENYAFMDAIDSYEDLVKNGYTEEEIYKKLGNANYVNALYENAADWYSKLIKLENTTIDANYYYRYAQSLKSLGSYDESNEWMQKFYEQKTKDQRAINYKEKENYIERIRENSGRYEVKNLTINSTASDFAPSFYSDKLVFSTARDTGFATKNIHKWNNGAFLNLHVSKILKDQQFSTPERFTKELNTKTHESSSVFTKDGKTVYFTRNNSKDGRFSRDREGVSRLKLFKSTLVQGEWSKAQELPFNSDAYSVAHPALSADEKTLYFSSDMPGTIGASDIFKVSVNEDNSYGVPENLGKRINTEARESFPFIDEKTIYFSSDGHPGLGGLDVFAAKLDGSSEEILNLGEPLNGKQDDFSYVIRDGNGYFASNREGGKGEDDIYSFQENQPLRFDCLAQLKGIVLDQETQQAIPEAQVSVVDVSGKIVTTTVSDKNGAFNVDVDCAENDLMLVVNKEAYDSKRTTFNMIAGQINRVSILLQKAQVELVPAVGSDLIVGLELNPILFDLDSSEIRKDAALILNKASDFLKKNSGIRIEVKSHTDAKASKSYNQRLSESRAKATYEYLVKLGVDASTISFKGYGEDELLNDCVNWEQCSKDENEKNRRSELIVVE